MCYCFALFAWFAWAVLLAEITKTATGKTCNKCKPFGQLGLIQVYKYSDTNVVFQTAIFVNLLIRNNKMSSGIDNKTSTCLSRNCLYFRCISLLMCLLVTAFWFIQTCHCCFFADFPTVIALLVKNCQIELLKIWYISFVWPNSYFSFSI